ncbi:MAG TPA: D-glycero-beta-D-manno-heptose-7-phosphate kinase [Acetobacteraceae bacterium]|nr:D-glycero-beta-D-manno-heptose-7-phosphate kinase [Acetobacteraceae bacterium]
MSSQAPSPSDADFLARFGAHAVLVLGDLMLDRYVLGEVRRISPEAPIPVLRAGRSRAVLGGAGNVAQNVAALGGRAILLGVIGDDEAGEAIGRVLAEAGPGVRASIACAAGRPTTVKTRFMSGPHQLLRVDQETTEAIAASVCDDLLARFAAALPEAEIVVLSDYAKGALCDAVLGRAIALARAAGKPVIADPKRPDLAAYRRASVLTPNEAEIAAATGIAPDDDAAAEAAGRAALAASAAAAVLVKRSARGLTLVRPDMPALHIPTTAREVADVSGAGDTLIAAFAVMLAAGADLPQSAAIANTAAGISVGKQGTATVAHAELAASLHQRDLLATDEKVMPLDAAIARIVAWRREGLRVGFTNGVFDLIHPGHVRLLTRARATCDRLVVGLNTDASVRRLKGPTRPVQTETARATVMASMRPVDAVILFAEDTPERLIAAIRPDVLIKGADYRVEQVVGAEIVQAHGGQVVLIDLQEGHSTSNTIRRISAAPAS